MHAAHAQGPATHKQTFNSITTTGTPSATSVLTGGAYPAPTWSPYAISALSDVSLSSLASGQSLFWNGSKWVNQTPAAGTVTSVGLTVPGFLSVAGSPITGSGTFAVTLATQTANAIFAGPASGASAAPTFRALVVGDIPSLTHTQISDFTSTVYSLLSASAPLSFNSSTGAIGVNAATTSAAGVVQAGAGLSITGGTLSLPPTGTAGTYTFGHSATYDAYGRETAAANPTGTPSSTTFLRGDGTWATPAGATSATTSAQGIVQLAGDLGGSGTTAATPKVGGLQGVAVSTTAPNDQQVLVYSSTAGKWGPGTVAPNSTLSQILSGTDYTLTNAYAAVPGQSINLPNAGSYLISAILDIVGGATANDAYYAKFFNSTDNADVTRSERRTNAVSASGEGQLSLQNLVTVTAAKTIQVYAQNATAARGTISGVRSSLNYISFTASSVSTTGKPPTGTAIDTSQSISSGLVLSYLLGEGSGTSIADSSSTADTGTLSASTMWATDSKYSQAVTFSGTQYASNTHNSAPNVETYTVALAFKTTMTGTGVFFYQGANTTSSPYAISAEVYISGGAVVCNAQDATHNPVATSASSTYNDGNWHTVIVTRTAGSALKLYVDAAAAVTATDTNTVGGSLSSTSLSAFGARPTTGTGPTAINNVPFTGSLAYLNMWNTVLTSSQITAIQTDPFAMYR